MALDEFGTARDLAVAVIDELENPCGERPVTVARDRAACRWPGRGPYPDA